MRILLCILFVLCTSFAFAQTGSITGKIIDPDTNEPLIGVTVLVEGTNKGEITDLNGSFTILNVPVGPQTLRLKYVGYEETTVNAVVTEGQTVSVGEVLLHTTAIGLQEVEVFANMVDDRKTPVAVSTISQLEIDERLGGMQLPELLNETPGIYATQGDGAFGDAYVNIRGFGQEEVLFMINGVPMNDMENGIMYWSNFAGLSEVTRNMQVQRGLGASKLAVNSVGGTINIVTLPSSRKKGGSADVIFGNATYANRYRFTLNSGLTKSGWAFTFQGSRSVGEGIREGAYVDAWSYFLTASKQLGSNHTLLFTAFGAPTDRGRAWNTNTATYEKFDNYLYNEAWGYLNGQKYNTSQNKSHKPQVTAMHIWTASDKFTVTSSLYASLARVYGTSVLRAQGAPAVGITTTGQQDLQPIYNANAANIQTIENVYGEGKVTGARSNHILEGRYNNHNWYGLISNINYQLNPTTSLVAGVDLRDYTASHFGRVNDLLGGEYWVDRDRFTGEDNNLLTPNRIARKGDKIRYDYDGNVRWGSMFAQVEKTIGQWDIFASGNFSRVQLWREGNMWSGVQDAAFYNVYIYNSLGSSDKRVFNNYNLKAGVNYRITGRHNVFVNAGKFTRAPFLRNAFATPEYSNDYINGITNENIQAAEVGYSYRTGKFRANLNLYVTEWKDKAFINAGSVDFIDESTNQRQAVNGVAALHKGIEIDARYEVLHGLELTGMFSKGHWEWSSDARATITNAQTGAVKETRIYTKGLKVGNSAQTTGYLGLHYKGMKDAYVGARFNYFGDLYEMFDPAERVQGYKPVRKLPNYHILDIYGGYYFKVGDLRARTAVNVHNILNDRFIRRSDERFDVQEAYGFPINYNVAFTLYF